jgi:hypothetical protein
MITSLQLWVTSVQSDCWSSALSCEAEQCKAIPFSKIITTVDIIHGAVLDLKTRRFEDWILSPSSCGNYSDGPKR